ncbi:1323_t:CDS:1, partial [Rhizophagus irregularis]
MISSGDKKSSLYGGTFESLLQLPLKCPGSQQCIQRSTPRNSGLRLGQFFKE